MSPAVLLLGLTAVRLLVAALSPLAPDEAYYWVWSRALQPGYLDHPPMVALWIRAGTLLVGETPLGVRLLGPLAGLAGSVLLADTGERLWPGRRIGVAAAALLNATLLVGAGAVTMTPDTPLMFFTVAAIWALARVGEDARWWGVVGLVAGAALDSKYTAVLIGLGIPIWLVWARITPSWRSPWLWGGGLVALLVFAPVLSWNAGHGWVSFVKQGERSADWEPRFAAQYVPELIGSQIALATPGIFALFAAGLWRLRRGGRAAEPALVGALAIPGLLVFLQHAFGGRVQANWLAVLYPPLALGAAAVGARWWRAAAGLGFGLTALVYVQAASAPVALPRRFDPTLIRLAGWDAVARDADALRRQNGLAFLAAEDYSLAAELAWWSPGDAPVVGAEPRWALFALPRPSGGAGLVLVSERRQGGPDPAAWSEAREIGHLTRARGGVEAERFRVYRATLREGASAAVLPRRGATMAGRGGE